MSQVDPKPSFGQTRFAHCIKEAIGEIAIVNRILPRISLVVCVEAAMSPTRICGSSLWQHVKGNTDAHVIGLKRHGPVVEI